jgi:hypothetical protein
MSTIAIPQLEGRISVTANPQISKEMLLRNAYPHIAGFLAVCNFWKEMLLETAYPHFRNRLGMCRLKS